MGRSRLLSKSAAILVLMVLIISTQFAGVARADVLDPVTQVTDPLVEPLPDPAPPLPEDPVGEVVDAVNEVLAPPPEPEPPAEQGEEEQVPSNDSTQNETTSQTTSQNGGSATTSSYDSESTTTTAASNSPGPIASAATASDQGATAGTLSGGSMTTVLRASGDPDAIEFHSPSYGSRSTRDIFELARALRLAPATTARILAPFPVAGPASYSDDWGQPRFNPYFHVHEGTDIFAESGTPVIAASSGAVTNLVPISAVGGTTLSLTAPDGTYFYYAHLSGFAPGLYEGKVVALGEVLGFVGSSGNAEGTHPHLHFEIHPDGGRAVSPVPYLDRWLEEALQTVHALEASPSSGLGQLVQRIPWAVNDSALSLARHLKSDQVGASTATTLGGWAAILSVFGWALGSRRRSRRGQLSGEGFLTI